MIKTLLNVLGDQNVSEHQGALSSINRKLIKTTGKNEVLFSSHMDLDGRSWERGVFEIFILLASSDACFFFSGGAARVVPLHPQNSGCTGIDIQSLRTCSDKCHKSSIISIKMGKSSFERLPLRLSKRQSPTTVLFRTTLTRTITIY